MLNYSVKGEGIPVVLLHGFLESSSMWDFLPLNDLKMKIIRIDLPGHGKSIHFSDTNPTINYFAFCVIEVLDELAVNEFHLIGHSMGGYVGLLLKEIDSRCKKIVLVNSNFWEDTEQKKKDRIRVAEIALKAKKIFIQEAIPNLFGKPENFQTEIFQLKNEAMEMLPESIAYASLAMRERNDFTGAIDSNPADYFIIHGILDRLVDADFLRKQLSSDKNLFIIVNNQLYC